MTPRVSDKPLLNPFTVIVDSREQAPYTFHGLTADARYSHRPLTVPRAFSALRSGDYSIAGAEHLVAIERKSLPDLYSTLGHGRERFEREHERLAGLDFAAVVIEATWEEILAAPPPRSALLPKTVIRTAMAWSMRYGVHWWAIGGRRMTEVATFRLLEQWWRRWRKLESDTG